MLLALLGCGVEAHAQQGENLYAAPGMPVLTTRRMSVAAAPVAKPWFTQPLPRFWKSPDSLQIQQGGAQLRQAIGQRLHYPKLAMASQLGGTVKVRLVVAPSGVPLASGIVESTFACELPDKKAGEALQNEALRVAQLLRFQPKIGLNDTLTIPFSYYFETGW